MKINRLETHDRLEHFKKDQEINIFEGADDCMKKNPLSLQFQDKCHYIYLFAHPRTADDGITKKMFWQPRLTKPEPQTNSYCFRAISKTDIIQVCWLLPPRELWSQYRRSNVTEDSIVLWSINEFRYNKKQLEAPEHDDLSDEKVEAIYRSLAHNKREKVNLI